MRSDGSGEARERADARYGGVATTELIDGMKTTEGLNAPGGGAEATALSQSMHAFRENSMHALRHTSS
jgi:hypothetical protein